MAIKTDPNFDKAITEFTAAIRINPKNGYVFCARGYSYRQKDEKAKADADFAQARNLGYKVPGAGPVPTFRLWSILWASPYTLLGLLLGVGVASRRALAGAGEEP